MRVLMLSDYFYPILLGGGERRMYEIAKRLAKKHEIHIVTRKLAGTSNYEVHEGIHIHRVFVPSKGIALESPINGLFFMITSFFKSIELGDFDVYAPQQFFPLLPSWLISKIKRKPILATIHDVYASDWTRQRGLKGQLMAFFEQITLRLPYKKVITVSQISKEKLLSRKIPERKIEIIPNGVDLQAFDRVEVKKSKRPRIIYIGRLVGYKHVDDLLKAFSGLDLDAKLYIVGEGPEREKLEALAEKLKVDHNVTFTGFVGEQRKIELLKSSHALVLPSTTEGFGIALVEAMAAKTPVIAADIPALRELVGDKEIGLLFRPRDVDALKTKLELLLKEGKLNRRFSQKGYEFVKRKFSWNEIAKKVEDVFKAVSAS